MTANQPSENPIAAASTQDVRGSGLSVLRAVTVKVNITACKYTMGDAREALAAELRRIAETLEDDPDTFAESGNMTGSADYGGWEISDPWENDQANNSDVGPAGAGATQPKETTR